MKTLKVLLQEVVSGIKAWVNSNFAQESNTVHKTGNETVNGDKTFTGNVFQNRAGGTNVYCATCDGAVKGDLTSSGTFSIVCKDGSNASMETSGLAAVYMGQDTSGSYVALRADTTYNNTRYNAAVSLDIDPTTANNNAIFRPRRDNTIDLGSSSYQFKNLYANNYYYKGTAWGLDKLNTWTGGNIFSAETYNNHVLLTNTTLDLSNGNPALSETNQGMILFTDKTKWEGKTYARLQSWTASDQTITVLAATYRPDANTESDFSVWVSNTQNMKSFHPYGVSEAHLGTSSYKWKTLNGINPGALSLPRGYTEEGADKDYIDIKSVIQTLDNTEYYYTLPDNGWICVRAEQAKRVHVTLKVGWFFGQSICSPVDATLIVTAPFRKGDQITLKVEAVTLQEARFYPMQGNV